MKALVFPLLLVVRLAEVFQVVEGSLYEYLSERIISELRYEGLIKDKCMTRLIKDAGTYLGSTYMFIADKHRHEELLYNLQVKFLHSYYTKPGSLGNTDLLSSYHLQIFGNDFTLEEVVKIRAPFQGTKFFLLVRDYSDVVEKFKVLWKYRIVDVVATFVKDDIVNYYTYFPYCSTHCGEVGKPSLVASCNISSGIFGHRETLFPSKVKNLHGCPINVTFTENIPSSYYGLSEKLEGWEVDLLNEIVERMNGVPKYHILKSKNRVYRTITGYGRLLEDSEVGGGLVVSLRGLVKTDFCLYGHSLCATWIVPKKLNSSLSFDFLIKVFPVNVWILVLLTYSMMTAAIRVFFKAPCQNILFKLLPFLLGTTTKTKRTSRFLGALWLWFCLNINCCYQSRYQSLLLVPDSPKQLSSTKEVLESNLKILGVSDVVTDAIPFFKGKYNISKRRLRMLNRVISFDEWVHRMTVKKDSAFLGFKETVQHNVEGTQIADKIYIPQYCIIKYLLAFVLKKNSHLTESFVKFANRLNENGFLTHFIRKHLLTESKLDIPKKVTSILKPLTANERDGGPPPIDMSKMYVVFICHLMGTSLALTVFVIEILSKCDWRNLKRNIVREMETAWPYKD